MSAHAYVIALSDQVQEARKQRDPEALLLIAERAVSQCDRLIPTHALDLPIHAQRVRLMRIIKRARCLALMFAIEQQGGNTALERYDGRFWYLVDVQIALAMAAQHEGDEMDALTHLLKVHNHLVDAMAQMDSVDRGPRAALVVDA